jgi:hypothetical protein
MGGADQALLHSRSGLDGQQFLHQGFVEAIAKLGKHFGQDKVLLGAVHPDDCDSAGVHHGKVGPQPATNLFV